MLNKNSRFSVTGQFPGAVLDMIATEDIQGSFGHEKKKDNVTNIKLDFQPVGIVPNSGAPPDYIEPTYYYYSTDLSAEDNGA